jgi:hypothetical protein
MRLEAILVTYAGLVCWALSTQRLRRELKVHGQIPALWPRFFGVILIAISAGWAVQDYGPEQGAVAMIGMISAAALLLVLILSLSPKLSVRMGAAALMGGSAISIVRVLSA